MFSKGVNGKSQLESDEMKNRRRPTLKNAIRLVGYLLTAVVLSGCGRGQSFTFVQMCDTQLGFGGYKDDVARFEQAVTQINAMKPDFVVICGDLVNKFNDDSVAEFNRIKGGFAMPCYCAPGNHDLGNSPSHAGMKRYRTLVGKDYYSFEHKGYTFVITNTQFWKGYLKGESEKHDSWFKETLKAASKKGSPLFVVGHYPLFLKTADEEEGYYNLPPAKRKELLRLFEVHGVVAMLAGHTHKTIINRHKDIQLVTGETTSVNFDKHPFGFRIWRVTESRSVQHEFVPLQK